MSFASLGFTNALRVILPMFFSLWLDLLLSSKNRTDRKLVLTGFEILGVVDDNFGKTGKGNSFMETAIQNAKTKGFRTIDVAVFTDNTNMLVLVIKINLNP